MKNVMILLTIVAMLAVTGAKADFLEDFDSYANGDSMHGVGGWEGWHGDSGATAYVSNSQSSSPSNSVDINGGADLVRPFDGMTSGTWTITAQQYIPTSSDSGLSYFVHLNSYAPGNNSWSDEMTFNLATGKVSNTKGTPTDRDIVRDTWVELKLVVDLDVANGLVTSYYNGDEVSSHAWYGAKAEIAAIDLFANSADTIYYDDIKYVPEPATMVLLGIGGIGVLIRRKRR